MPPGRVRPIDKPANKVRRQVLHIKRKKSQDAGRRAERFGRKKDERKNPRLREDRLRKNVPLTLDRKRVWDEVADGDEGVLGASVDVERIKRQKLAREEQDLEGIEATQEAILKQQREAENDTSGDLEQDDKDSMLDSDSEDEEEPSAGEASAAEVESKLTERRPRSSMRTATERATSPSYSTTSTNLSLAPEALKAKFPSLFPAVPPPPPKTLITTGINSTLHEEAKLLTSLFPHSVYIRRSSHRYGHKFSVREISSFASNRNYTSVLVLEEDQKRPSGLTVVHLPSGPTFHFTISNWVEGKKLPGHGNATNHTPELVLNNFRTPIGLLTAHLFRSLWPAQPEIQGRQVVTLHNQRDYIFVRRHRYVFRSRRDTEKKVTGTDGNAVKGVEDVRAGLQELGPRFTVKLRRIDKGIQRKSGQEWEWKSRMEKVRTKFQL
ncbi:MAG: hypothetical protein Q9160_000424 [Pyrenula sp. 1 TL-2023]